MKAGFKIANVLTGARLCLMVPLFALLTQGPGYAALAVFLLAGLTDILDGYLARKLNQASPFGAFFDLLADRMLTLTLFAGLLSFGAPSLGLIVVAVVLIGRDLLVAGLNEALPGQLNIRVTPLERIKIACQFLGFALLITPAMAEPVLWAQVGLGALYVGAALSVMTMIDYSRRAAKVFMRQDASAEN